MGYSPNHKMFIPIEPLSKPAGMADADAAGSNITADPVPATTATASATSAAADDASAASASAPRGRAAGDDFNPTLYLVSSSGFCMCTSNMLPRNSRLS
jgi:hypothetical protein